LCISGLLPTVAAEIAVATNMATLMAISVRVTGPQRRVADRRRPLLGARLPACPARTHSGHWKPTEAGIMHSGQMGRPQRVHEIPEGRSGCR